MTRKIFNLINRFFLFLLVFISIQSFAQTFDNASVPVETPPSPSIASDSPSNPQTQNQTQTQTDTKINIEDLIMNAEGELRAGKPEKVLELIDQQTESLASSTKLREIYLQAWLIQPTPAWVAVKTQADLLKDAEKENPWANFALARYYSEGTKKIDLSRALSLASEAKSSKSPPPGASNLYWKIFIRKFWTAALGGIALIVIVVIKLRERSKNKITVVSRLDEAIDILTTQSDNSIEKSEPVQSSSPPEKNSESILKSENETSKPTFEANKLSILNKEETFSIEKINEDQLPLLAKSLVSKENTEVEKILPPEALSKLNEKPLQKSAQQPTQESSPQRPVPPIRQSSQPLVQEPPRQPPQPLVQDPSRQPPQSLVQDPSRQPPQSLVQDPSRQHPQPLVQDPSGQPPQSLAQQPPQQFQQQSQQQFPQLPIPTIPEKTVPKIAGKPPEKPLEKVTPEEKISSSVQIPPFSKSSVEPRVSQSQPKVPPNLPGKIVFESFPVSTRLDKRYEEMEIALKNGGHHTIFSFAITKADFQFSASPKSEELPSSAGFQKLELPNAETLEKKWLGLLEKASSKPIPFFARTESFCKDLEAFSEGKLSSKYGNETVSIDLSEENLEDDLVAKLKMLTISDEELVKLLDAKNIDNLPALLEYISTRPDPKRLALIAAGLGNYHNPEITGILAGLLHHETKGIIFAAMGGLQTNGDPTGIFHICPFLKSEDKELADAAKFALYSFGPTKILQVFSKLSEISDEKTKVSSVFLLSRMKGKAVTELLVKLLKDPSDKVRQEVLMGMTFQKDPVYISILRDFIKTSSEEEKKLARKAMIYLQGFVPKPSVGSKSV
ncbi:MAG: hypothetical protein HQM08_05105 [Candidatus Riflebacteria bacterium]|nr:hypothetical protein [Candidatus Riflebacteria bacterium]